MSDEIKIGWRRWERQLRDGDAVLRLYLTQNGVYRCEMDQLDDSGDVLCTVSAKECDPLEALLTAGKNLMERLERYDDGKEAINKYERMIVEEQKRHE
jgi:hypothetical protein